MALHACLLRKTYSALLLLITIAGLSFTPPAARADTLDDVLDVMITYKVVDPAVGDAREMLRCLVNNNGDATACFNLPTEAEKQAGKAAGKFMPDDPKIRAIIDLVLAAKDKKWFTVLELAGLDITLPLLCDFGTSATGPIGKWVCAGPFRELVNGSIKPVAKEVFSVLASSDSAISKVFQLVTLVGNVDLACKLIPIDFPGKDESCSLLGQIIAEIGGLFVDAGKYGAKLVVATADEVENLVFGDDSHMPYDRYYGLYWLPWLQNSVNLCVTNGCSGVGSLNARIWDACVDYFDAHNQYRSTAKKTCDDMRDKRYAKAYPLLAEALVIGARSYARELRAGAKAWAITEYGKGNQNAIRNHFLTLCETELEQGYPMPTNNPSMCDGYTKIAGLLPKEVVQGLYKSCMADVAAQQVKPTVWHNACKTAEPHFISLLQTEQQALEVNLTKLVALGCHPPSGWTASQGLQFQCQTYAGYDECHTVMVAGANSICKVDRSKADIARAKEIHNFLGAKRCSLNGTEILCHRPWKHSQCKQLVNGTPGIQVSKSALTCAEESVDYFKIAFANQALLEELNKPRLRGEPTPSCSWIEDKAKIKCLRIDKLKTLTAAKPEFNRPLCNSDPNYDGSDFSCFLQPYDLNSSPQPQSASATSSIPAQASVPGAVLPPGSRQAAPVAPQANPLSRTAAPATRAMNAEAPPNPCGIDVMYYVPDEPVVLAATTAARSLDQVAIRCNFRAVSGRIEWPTCDAEAKTAMQILQLAKESGSRYSGLLSVDGQNVGVATSPINGGDFSSEHVWSYDKAGDHAVSCQIENGLKYAAKGGLDHLVRAISHNVDVAAENREFVPLDINSMKSIAVKRVQASISPLPEGATALLRVAGSPDFDSRKEYSAVTMESGAVAESDDWNDGSAQSGTRNKSSIVSGGETILPPQEPPPAGGSTADGVDIWLTGLTVYKLDPQGEPLDSQSFQGGDNLLLHCKIHAFGPQPNKPVRFRFTVDGQVIRDVLANVPAEGKHTTVNMDWVPPTAGKYAAACEVNFDLKIPESNVTNNIREWDITVSAIPRAGAGATVAATMSPSSSISVSRPKAMEQAGLQSTTPVSELLPDLSIVTAKAKLVCKDHAFGVVATGTVQNDSTVAFTPPAINPLVYTNLKVGNKSLSGRTILPAFKPGETRQIDVDMTVGEHLTKDDIGDGYYSGQFTVNLNGTVVERIPILNNDQHYSGQVSLIECP